MEKQGPVSLNLLCVVCDREKREKVVALMEKHKAYFNLMVLGKGTANSRILGYLGLGETEKAVFFSVLPKPIATELMKVLDDAMDFKRPGHGISFTAKFTQGCYHKRVHLASDEDGGNTVEQTSQSDLIMVILNRGYTEEVMDVARPAGATGGTVLHARGCGMSGAEKFFGVSIQPEKEMIMIVADNTASCAIMDVIAQNVGPGTDPGAVSFSMPINRMKGIGADVPDAISQ